MATSNIKPVRTRGRGTLPATRPAPLSLHRHLSTVLQLDCVCGARLQVLWLLKMLKCSYWRMTRRQFSVWIRSSRLSVCLTGEEAGRRGVGWGGGLGRAVCSVIFSQNKKKIIKQVTYCHAENSPSAVSGDELAQCSVASQEFPQDVTSCMNP